MSVNYTTIVVVYQVYVDRNTWHVQTEKIIYYATEKREFKTINLNIAMYIHKRTS